MLRHVLLGLLGSIALFLLAIPCWIQIHRGDIASAGDADFTVTRSALGAGERNGYDDLLEAHQRMFWPDERAGSETCCFDNEIQDYREGRGPIPDRLDEYFVRNRASLEALARASRATCFRFPALGSGAPAHEAIRTVMAATRLIRISSTMALAGRSARDPGDRIDQMMLGLRLGHRLSEAEGLDLMLLMMAVAHQSIAATDIAATVPLLSIGSAQSRAFVTELERHRISADAWSNAWTGEYQKLRAGFEAVDRAETEAWGAGRRPGIRRVLRWVPRDYLFQPNRTLHALAVEYRARRDRTSLFCTDAVVASRFHRRKGRELSTLELARIVYSPNPVGNILSWLAEPPDEEGYDRKRCQADSKIGLLQVQIAAHAYWQAHGELPAELEALVPDWLAAIPRDPFDGDALRYSADDARAWSVGDDFADEPVPPIPALTNPAEPSVSLRF